MERQPEGDLSEYVIRYINPRKHVKAYIDKDLRPHKSRRTLMNYRQIQANINVVKTADGSSIVKIGKTNVLCGVYIELVAPEDKTFNRGLIEVKTSVSDLSRLSTYIEEHVLNLPHCTSVLERLYSSVIDTDALSLNKGKMVWLVSIQLMCHKYDGGFWDSAVLAIYLALKTVKIPVMEYDEESKKFYMKGDLSIPMPLNYCPVSTTFGLFEGKLFTDLTLEEEVVVDTCITVITDKELILTFDKRGPHLVSDEQMKTCIRLAKSRDNFMKKAIDNILNQSNDKIELSMET